MELVVKKRTVSREKEYSFRPMNDTVSQQSNRSVVLKKLGNVKKTLMQKVDDFFDQSSNPQMKISKDGKTAQHLGGDNHVMLTRSVSTNPTSVFRFKI